MSRVVKVFDVLYGNSKNNKVKRWAISVNTTDEESYIIVEHGYIDGAMITNTTTITKGKNIGKVNETTHLEQALSEAASKWSKKKFQGYSEDNNKKKDIILPMLALDYNKYSKNIEFPSFIQPKLDGVRCIFYKNDLVSRTGKVFTGLRHILEELQDLDLVLDGELYSYSLPFQQLVGLVRKETLTDTCKSNIKKIIFIIYDVVVDDKNYKERYDILSKFFKTKGLQYTKFLDTCIAKDHNDINRNLVKYINKGYEGAIIRNFKGLYIKNARSKDLQKYKKFKDNEFDIIGGVDGVGVEEGLIIWICVTQENKRFNVRPKGTHEERRELFKNKDRYIGKKLIVKYFELTDDNVPRFPVGVAIRDYE